MHDTELMHSSIINRIQISNSPYERQFKNHVSEYDEVCCRIGISLGLWLTLCSWASMAVFLFPEEENLDKL